MDLQPQLLQESLSYLQPRFHLPGIGSIGSKVDAFAEAFYVDLFTRNAAIRTLFCQRRVDLPKQKKKLMQMIGYLVLKLNQGGLDAVVGDVQGLVLQHRSYGVADAWYTDVKESILATFPKFIPERVWKEKYVAQWSATLDVIIRVVASQSLQQRQV